MNYPNESEEKADDDKRVEYARLKPHIKYARRKVEDVAGRGNIVNVAVLQAYLHLLQEPPQDKQENDYADDDEDILRAKKIIQALGYALRNALTGGFD